MNDEKQEQQLAFNSRASLCQGSAELLEVYGNKLERNIMIIILMQGSGTKKQEKQCIVITSNQG